MVSTIGFAIFTTIPRRSSGPSRNRSETVSRTISQTGCAVLQIIDGTGAVDEFPLELRGRQTETLIRCYYNSNPLTKKTPFPSSSSVVLFAQMMFADQMYRTRLRSFFTELFCEAHF